MTIPEYLAFSVVVMAYILCLAAFVTMLTPAVKVPKWEPFWIVASILCQVMPPVIVAKYFFMHLELWWAMKDAIEDVDFMDEIFKELCQDAKNLLEKRLQPGDERLIDMACLADDYAAASEILIKFLVWEEKHIAKGKEMLDVEKRGVSRGEGYILKLKFVLEMRKQIILDGVDPLVNLPAGAERMNSVIDMCKEYEWIVKDRQEAKRQGWWNAEKDVEKSDGDGLESLLQQSILIVPEAYSCLKWLEARKGKFWTNWRIFNLQFGYKWIKVSQKARQD
jgi:hypothetical protein